MPIVLDLYLSLRDPSLSLFHNKCTRTYIIISDHNRKLGSRQRTKATLLGTLLAKIYRFPMGSDPLQFFFFFVFIVRLFANCSSSLADMNELTNDTSRSFSKSACAMPRPTELNTHKTFVYTYISLAPPHLCQLHLLINYLYEA